MASAKLVVRPVVALVRPLPEEFFSKRLHAEKNGRKARLSFSSYKALRNALKAFKRSGYRCWVQCDEHWIPMTD